MCHHVQQPRYHDNQPDYHDNDDGHHDDGGNIDCENEGVRLTLVKFATRLAKIN